ncbi:Glyoxalase/bleomycin resistance protein/dioxygenase [Lophiotrema nucula]|uniref:Glyoxalase/bleomycin resistance protein/dioxygenase n=1 Tax=Lophiotrema nucula TaxID=690887 RepID=A0A6A5ZBA1_9PLEO|nr:Glyoxalase/bleomycin resistance protein/dioxygenase [Lophiotrema nucula]
MSAFQPTIFVNLPVASLDKALRFYEALGMVQNQIFSSADTACMALSPAISLMLMEPSRFQTFLPASKTPVTGKESQEGVFCITVEKREDVDRVLKKCEEAGGKLDPTTLPEMPGGYGRSVEDVDGHLWEVAWMGGMGEQCS